MSLIDEELDDAAVLAAEDAAIIAAAHADQTSENIPTGGALARLIEDLTHGGAQDAQVPVRHREG